MWFRRDLRAHDNAALAHALQRHQRVFCVFVLDTCILQSLQSSDRRVAFIHASLVDLEAQLARLSALGGQRARLLVLHGDARDCIPQLAHTLAASAVYANHDDEPAAHKRDAAVAQALAALNCRLHTFKDHVIFERQELLTQTKRAFTVFTPYRTAWLKKLADAADATDALATYSPAIKRHAAHLASLPPEFESAYRLPSLAAIGFQAIDLAPLGVQGGASGARAQLNAFLPRLPAYHERRDFPALQGTSHLGIHLRFGTLSIRQLVRLAQTAMLAAGGAGDAAAPPTSAGMGAATWLSELIWRDFFHQIMANFPHAMQASFKPDYDRIQWERGPVADARFAAWCDGRTGYPLVDAGMRQLRQTGRLHNRLRMVTASFLTKHLGIDWRWGERYFAQQLLDFDLAANNGGWQWAASSGCDAQPYFRIFNPVLQSQKFDPEGLFIKRFVPELSHLNPKQIHQPWQSQAPSPNLYPAPIVDHAAARQQTLARYAAALHAHD